MPKDKTIYVVSGYMRTGTSMMMSALETGGYKALKSKVRDKLNKHAGDEYYQPNPNGFYEDLDEWRKPDFPSGHEGELVKIMSQRIGRIPVLKYKVVFMLRDKEEIRQSYEAAFNRPAPNISNYDELMQRVVKWIKNRRDMQVVTLNYRDVIEKPRESFVKLQKAGWDFDIEKAIAKIDKKLYRFRKERLEVGI